MNIFYLFHFVLLTKYNGGTKSHTLFITQPQSDLIWSFPRDHPHSKRVIKCYIQNHLSVYPSDKIITLIKLLSDELLSVLTSQNGFVTSNVK
jgi:hypothetical protein